MLHPMLILYYYNTYSRIMQAKSRTKSKTVTLYNNHAELYKHSLNTLCDISTQKKTSYADRGKARFYY